MTDPHFFGYGSLVNRRTHDYPAARAARIRGWARSWCQTGLRDVAFLTAVPDASAEIDGLIAQVPGQDWNALDAREWAYARRSATAAPLNPAEAALQVAIYEVPADAHRVEAEPAPILLSYLDVVVQGYLNEFGPDGAHRFFATTCGWRRPILNDRATPRYPRHQRLTADETDFVDAQLSRLASVVKELD